ncbi:MAG: DUF3494 domain-containing protein [Pyrinomonadaceae bacterium]|nr:DUF3494 domain-containing protein [Pyrinomonadaceae bacterium]
MEKSTSSTHRKVSVGRLIGLLGLLAIVLVASFFINALPLGVRAEASSTAPPLEAVAPSLGTAASFAVLAATTVTNTGLTVVTGNLGVSPGTAVTGFPPGIVVGTIFTGAGSMAGTAQTDATAAYNNLAGQACDTVLTGQDLGGLVLGPGVYCFSSSAFLTGTLTLDGQGNPNAVFVFQIGSTLVTASASQVVLINGANACNVFFQVGSSATLGTGTQFQGNILALTSITATTGANLNGRAIALNGAVTLDTNNITNCLGIPPPPTPTPTPTPTPPPPTPTPTPTPTPCVPITTVTEGDLFPGGLASFGVTSGPNSVTVDHVNAGTGLQSFTVVGTPTNAVVTIPAFTPGTFAPVTATFTVINPSQPVDFTLRAASTFHSIFIRVRCIEQQPPNTFSGRATALNANIAVINATLVDTGPLPPQGGLIIAPPLLSASVLGGALATGLLNAETQGAGDQSRSLASVENFILNVGGNTITGVIVQTISQCTCTAGGPICEGDVEIGNLRINGIQVVVSGAENQMIGPLLGGGFVVINETTRSGSGNFRDITVNGVRIFIPPVIPGTPAVADVILASAYSDINCGTSPNGQTQ